MLNRRRFIGLVGLGAFSALFAGLRVFKTATPLVAELDFRNMSKRHATIMQSAFISILAVEDPIELKNILLKADIILGRFEKRAQFELMGALEILEQSPIWQIGSVSRFSNLQLEEQLKVLRKWSQGIKPGRALTQGLKEFSVFVFYSQDQTWNEIGYGGPWVHRK